MIGDQLLKIRFFLEKLFLSEENFFFVSNSRKLESEEVAKTYNILGNQSLRETGEVENYLALFWWKIFFTKMNNSFFYFAVQRKINILKVLSEILNIAKINSFLTRH